MWEARYRSEDVLYKSKETDEVNIEMQGFGEDAGVMTGGKYRSCLESRNEPDSLGNSHCTPESYGQDRQAI